MNRFPVGVHQDAADFLAVFLTKVSHLCEHCTDIVACSEHSRCGWCLQLSELGGVGKAAADLFQFEVRTCFDFSHATQTVVRGGAPRWCSNWSSTGVRSHAVAPTPRGARHCSQGQDPAGLLLMLCSCQSTDCQAEEQ